MNKEISSRSYAGIFDISISDVSVLNDPGIKPSHLSTDAIGGSYGIQWFQYYRDRKTNEIYKVSCTDGVYGGRGPYSDEDEKTTNDIYWDVIKRLENHNSSENILISLDERIVLQSFTHAKLFETSEGLLDGKQNLEEPKIGLFGYYHGISIVCVEDCQME